VISGDADMGGGKAVLLLSPQHYAN